jgi:hypothetical protein
LVELTPRLMRRAAELVSHPVDHRRQRLPRGPSWFDDFLPSISLRAGISWGHAPK